MVDFGYILLFFKVLTAHGPAIIGVDINRKVVELNFFGYWLAFVKIGGAWLNWWIHSELLKGETHRIRVFGLHIFITNVNIFNSENQIVDNFLDHFGTEWQTLIALRGLKVLFLQLKSCEKLLGKLLDLLCLVFEKTLLANCMIW